MTEKIYEVWYEFYDGTQANMNGYHKKIKVFKDKDKAIAEKERLSANGEIYYIKEVELDD